MLRTLALHMASLRSRASDAPADGGSLSASVRAICDEISMQCRASSHDAPTVQQEKTIVR